MVSEGIVLLSNVNFEQCAIIGCDSLSIFIQDLNHFSHHPRSTSECTNVRKRTMRLKPQTGSITGHVVSILRGQVEQIQVVLES